MKHIILISIFFILSSRCSESKKEEQDQPEQEPAHLSPTTDASFTDYLEKIPHLKLPLNLTCEQPPDGSTHDLDQSVIEKYGPENSRIAGKIAMTDKYSAILYLYPADIVLPIIQTTDNKGNKISELKLYERWCGEDAFSWGTSWAAITSDLTITLKDSAIIFKRNPDGQILEETRKTEVRHRVFKIDDSGRIIENKNEP